MAGAYKVPGVYVVEKGAFANSAVEVATAVPAFIGYTERAENKGASLLNRPWRIATLSEFHAYFGNAPVPSFTIDTAATGTEPDIAQGADAYSLNLASAVHRFYHSIVLFFANGGGACYIVSVGDFSGPVEKETLAAGIDSLLKEQEPTMVVVPDAVALPFADCIALQQDMLSHCGKMKNRFAILDVWEGFKDRRDGDCVDAFRGALRINNLGYAAAYYPWVQTSVVSASSMTYANIANADMLQHLLLGEVVATVADKKKADAITAKVGDIAAGAPADPIAAAELHKTLLAVSPLYGRILEMMIGKLALLPPSAAMAGVYATVDNSRGVWKAPANVGLNSVIAPAVDLTHDEQEDLNVSISGKSINAIRTFKGEGVLVWGARTLDGNSLDWRYINVRRTMIMLEESIKLASKAYVFEPNVANTWITIKSMIQNFLTGIWKRGGLAGSSPYDAFGVYVGLGETMTAEDILDGNLRVTVKVALIRPAEFIEITFQQQLQKS